MSMYAQRLGRELRVARSNASTGGIDVEEIVRLVDRDTVLLNVIYASNISGAKLDLEETVRRARAIKPDLHIVVDAVQHAPHGLIDLYERVTTSIYSKRMLESFGLEGAVRISPLHCNSAADIDRFLAITQAMAADSSLDRPTV